AARAPADRCTTAAGTWCSPTDGGRRSPGRRDRSATMKGCARSVRPSGWRHRRWCESYEIAVTAVGGGSRPRGRREAARRTASWRSIVLLVGLLGVRTGHATSAGDCARWRATFAEMSTGPLTVVVGTRRATWQVKLARGPTQQAAGFQCATPQEIQDT